MSEIISTTYEAVETYENVTPVFETLFREIKDLGKKKPEMVASEFKVNQINRVLKDLYEILKDEPTGKYLDLLTPESLPQFSDIILIMAQYEAALEGFKRLHYGQTSYGFYGWEIPDEDEEDEN